MPDELTATIDSAPAPASAPSSPPPSNDSQQVEPTAVPSAVPNGSAQAPIAPTEKSEWDGNLDSLKDLPKDQVEHAKSVRRYLTKEREKDAQRNADIRAKAEQFEKLQKDPALSEFQKWKEAQSMQPRNGPPPAQPQPMWSEMEWSEAQINPAKMAELVQRGIQSGVQQQINQYAPIVQQMQQKQAFLERSQEVQDFGELHPDMWDLYDAGIMKPLVQSIVDSGQGSIAEAYEKAKTIASHFKNQALQESQGRVLQKKAAVTAAPTPAGEASVIWVDSKEEANRISYENALAGRIVPIKYKPKR